MRGLLGAAFVAALRQLILVALLTAFACFLVTWHVSTPIAWSAILDGRAPPSHFVGSFLTWAFLATAVGSALTEDRFLDPTADGIHRGARAMFARNPAIAAKILMAQCLVGTALLAVLGLAPPPIKVTEIGKAWDVGFGQLVWSATLSVGVAAFGSTAHSAYRALKRRPSS